MSHERRNISEKSELLNDLHDCNINPDTREIWLHSWVGGDKEEAGIDYRVATSFEKNFRFLTGPHNSKKDEPILIHMHVEGGVWEDGFAIYDTIQTCEHAAVTILAYGYAMSMSSIILQAADYRVMMPHSCFMMHYGHTSLDDNFISALSGAELEKKFVSIMLGIYAKRCKESKKLGKKSIKAIHTFLDKKIKEKQEWYLNARETVEYGLADAVLGDKGYENITALAFEPS